MNPDRLAELEDERRFLLRSLRDLDAELAAGDVDERDYETLRDGYTKRAADVLRDIEEGKRRAAAAARAALAATARRRRRGARSWRSAPGGSWPARPGSGSAGDEITGGVAQRRRRRAPGQGAQRCSASTRARAQALYEQVLAERPDHPEALTYSGWLLFTASSGASDELRAAAVGARQGAAGPGRRRRRRRTPTRTASWPSSPPTPTTTIATARTEVDQCLALDPPAEVRALVEQFAATLDAPPTTG